MAGSYKHCVNDDGEFIGVKLLDNLGDAQEALEEMYGMIWFLAGSISENDPKKLVEIARDKHALGLLASPSAGNVRFQLSLAHLDEED